MEKKLVIMVTIEASSENDAVTALRKFNDFVNENKAHVQIDYDFSTLAPYIDAFRNK